jgi:hypothetical protein
VQCSVLVIGLLSFLMSHSFTTSSAAPDDQTRLCVGRVSGLAFCASTRSWGVIKSTRLNVLAGLTNAVPQGVILLSEPASNSRHLYGILLHARQRFTWMTRFHMCDRGLAAEVPVRLSQGGDCRICVRVAKMLGTGFFFQGEAGSSMIDRQAELFCSFSRRA